MLLRFRCGSRLEVGELLLGVGDRGGKAVQRLEDAKNLFFRLPVRLFAQFDLAPQGLQFLFVPHAIEAHATVGHFGLFRLERRFQFLSAGVGRIALGATLLDRLAPPRHLRFELSDLGLGVPERLGLPSQVTIKFL